MFGLRVIVWGAIALACLTMLGCSAKAEQPMTREQAQAIIDKMPTGDPLRSIRSDEWEAIERIGELDFQDEQAAMKRLNVDIVITVGDPCIHCDLAFIEDLKHLKHRTILIRPAVVPGTRVPQYMIRGRDEVLVGRQPWSKLESFFPLK